MEDTEKESVVVAVSTTARGKKGRQPLKLTGKSRKSGALKKNRAERRRHKTTKRTHAAEPVTDYMREELECRFYDLEFNMQMQFLHCLRSSLRTACDFYEWIKMGVVLVHFDRLPDKAIRDLFMYLKRMGRMDSTPGDADEGTKEQVRSCNAQTRQYIAELRNKDDNNKDNGGESVLPPITNKDEANSAGENKEGGWEQADDDGGLMRELLEKIMDARDEQRFQDKRTLLAFDFHRLRWSRQKEMIKKFCSVLPNWEKDYCEWISPTFPHAYFDRVPDEYIARLYSEIPMEWRIVTAEELSEWGRNHALETNMRDRRWVEWKKQKQAKQVEERKRKQAGGDEAEASQTRELIGREIVKDQTE
ncbi:hypothetical protein FQN55_002708 [Onygenales sp. PD_40]|nr:hypothetical protein FQN55_002708 [Onygenales sp. PD_40]KAK2793354.1 hypothetical protein FQN52_001491 [Onygenales sp. PD_12]